MKNNLYLMFWTTGHKAIQQIFLVLINGTQTCHALSENTKQPWILHLHWDNAALLLADWYFLLGHGKTITGSFSILLLNSIRKPFLLCKLLYNEAQPKEI